MKAIISKLQIFYDNVFSEGITGEIIRLIVSAIHRGMGVGKELVFHAESWLKTKGCNTIRVWDNAVRKEVHQFYLRMDFKEIKPQKVFKKMRNK